MRRSLPVYHQVEIESVTAEEAWNYSPYGKYSNAEYRLGKLFENINLPSEAKKFDDLKSFKDFFEISGRFTPEVKLNYQRAIAEDESIDLPYSGNSEKEQEQEIYCKDKLIFTLAARMALRVSTRTLQGLYNRLESKPKKKKDAEEADNEEACEIAEEMLRNAIDESNLPFWASSLLINRIIRRNSKGKCILDLTGNPIRRFKQHEILTRISTIPWHSDNTKFVSQALHFNKINEAVLELHNLEEYGESIPLPAPVAGWLMVLYDLLMLYKKPRIISACQTPHCWMPTAVAAHYMLKPVGEQSTSIGEPLLKLDWPLPPWDMFLNYFIFAVQWWAFLRKLVLLHLELKKDYYKKKIEKILGNSEEEIKKQLDIQLLKNDDLEIENYLRKIAIGAWIENVCSVGFRRGLWGWDQLNKTMDKDKYIESLVDKGSSLEDFMSSYREYVCAIVCELAFCVRHEYIGFNWHTVWEWIEISLPSFFFFDCVSDKLHNWFMDLIKENQDTAKGFQFIFKKVNGNGEKKILDDFQFLFVKINENGELAKKETEYCISRLNNKNNNNRTNELIRIFMTMGAKQLIKEWSRHREQIVAMRRKQVVKAIKKSASCRELIRSYVSLHDWVIDMYDQWQNATYKDSAFEEYLKGLENHKVENQESGKNERL